MKRIIFWSLLILALTVSCSSDDDVQSVQDTTSNFTNGVLVLNEGAFMSGNASVSFISNTGEIQNNIFSTVNNRALGDVAMNIDFYEDLAFIVVNNSNTVEVVDRFTFESKATIAGELYNPRYFKAYNGLGYISNWGDGNDANDDFIAIVDLNTFEITSKIPVAQGPERLEIYNNKLYIAQRGDYAFGNTISVMDLNAHSIVESIEIKDVPNGMQIENGNLFVMSSGKEAWTGAETMAALQKIDLQTHQIVDQIEFPSGVHPTHLQIENGNIYYVIGSDIYRTSTGSLQFNDSPMISTADEGVSLMYGFNVLNGWIYVCDAVDYVSNGKLFVFSLNGNLDSQYPIDGLIPNGVYFNN